jgi:Mn-dependent DtxR family transcriptional regulator
MINNMKSHSKKEIMGFLRKNKVITSSELSEFLKVSWNTADKYLLELALEKKVQRIKKKGLNFWILKL